MGHELIGEVTAAASGAEALAGRRVTVNPQVPCRACLACRSGSENICQHRQLSAGAAPAASASSLRCRRRCVHVIDDELDADVAVLAEPVATCVHAFRLSPVALPATVVVLGAGTIGTLTCIVARLLGVGRLVVSETDDERRSRAFRSRTRRSIRTSSSTPWPGAELVVDAVGSDATRAASVALLQPGGCAIWLGMHDPEATIPAFDLVVREQSILGSFAYTDADFARAVELLAEHQQAFRVPTKTSSLEEGGALFDELLAGGTSGFVKASLAPRRRNMRFDLLIRGGEVVDPGGGHDGRLDVAIERDRIAAVDREIPEDSAFRVIDATGRS